MSRSEIRHISTSWCSTVFAAAKFKSVVSIWNFATRERLAEFPTILDFGGTRLAIDEFGTKCIAGAYQRKGVCCHRTQDGEALWQRPDLGRVQHISILPCQPAIACGFDHRSLEILSLSDGKTLQKIRGCRWLHSSPLEPVQFADKSAPELQSLDGSMIARIDRETFAILSVAFGLGVLAISEAGGPMTVFDTRNGKRLWRYHPPHGAHVVSLGYNIETQRFLAVEWPFKKGGEKRLIELGRDEGNPRTVAPLPESAVEEFCMRGTRLLGAPGWVLNTTTGEFEEPFLFPTIDENQE
jgi:hypothetical protein